MGINNFSGYSTHTPHCWIFIKCVWNQLAVSFSSFCFAVFVMLCDFIFLVNANSLCSCTVMYLGRSRHLLNIRLVYWPYNFISYEVTNFFMINKCRSAMSILDADASEYCQACPLDTAKYLKSNSWHKIKGNDNSIQVMQATICNWLYLLSKTGYNMGRALVGCSRVQLESR